MTDDLTNSGFSVGDVVCLKGGGNKLTVSHMIDEEILVFWFANDKKVGHARFNPEQLVLANRLDTAEMNLEPPTAKANLEIMRVARDQCWKAGDIVHLNSGGPTMVVRSVSNDFATVDWIDSSGAHRETRFRQSTLSWADKNSSAQSRLSL